MTPPKEYRLVEYGPLGPAPTPPGNIALASPVITPGLGIGQARFGMSIEQVIERQVRRVMFGMSTRGRRAITEVA